MFKNTLSQKAKATLALLGKSKCLPVGSYLTGGSALALHFGHRISVDFDFFTPNSFIQEKVAKELMSIGKFVVEQITKDTLLGNFENIRFSLFRYDYPLLFQTIDLYGIKIATPCDIAPMKLAAIMDRGTKKDFIDLYFIIKNEIPLETCLKYYDKKYQALANNIYSIITSLSYFVDAENTVIPKMLKNVTWEEIRTFFERESIRLGKKYL